MLSKFSTGQYFALFLHYHVRVYKSCYGLKVLDCHLISISPSGVEVGLKHSGKQ